MRGVDYQGFNLDNWVVSNLTMDHNITVNNGSNIPFYDVYLSNSLGDRLFSDPIGLTYFDFVVTGNSQSGNKTTWDASVVGKYNLTINVSSSSTIINGIIDNQLFSIPLIIGYPDLGIIIKVPNKIVVGKDVLIKVIVTNKGMAESINSFVSVKLPKGFKVNLTSFIF